MSDEVIQLGDEVLDLSQWSTTPPGADGNGDPNAAASNFYEQAKPDVPVIDEPPEGASVLLWGIEHEGQRYRSAFVSELTGADEEAIARLPRNGTNFSIMVVDMHLRRAVDRIGPLDVADHPDILGELLISDRDILFKEILLATYGSTREYDEVICPTCGFEMQMRIDIAALIKVTKQRTFDSDRFTRTMRNGEQVVMRYARGKDQLSIYHDNRRELSVPEANTGFLAACVVNVDGEVVADPREVGTRPRRRRSSQHR